MSALEKRIEDLFGEEPFDHVDEELFKWLIYAYFERGNGIKELNIGEFERFRAKLILLVDAIYERYKAVKPPS